MILMLKTLIKLIIYYFIDLLVKPSREIKPNSLLLIRLDAIGDFVMFRNFIKELTHSKKYKDYKITLLGNSVWKSLVQEFDSGFIDNFIWIDRDKFAKNFLYRYKKLQEIVSVGYDIVLSPVFSREYFINDNIVKLINSKEKIGSIGDTSNMLKWQKNISDKYYDVLISGKDEIMFEFLRNKEFFENFLHIKLDIKKPSIKLKPKELPFKLPKRYAILFIGANASFRKWSIERFAKVGMWLKEKYGYEVVLCGAPSDSQEAAEFPKYFDGDYVDLVGETSLVDMLYVICNGNMMISNETSIPHLAVALEMKNIFVISNGNHFGRFTPYPKKVCENYHVIYHPKIEKDLGDYEKLSDSFGNGSTLDINLIRVDSVKKKLKR